MPLFLPAVSWSAETHQGRVEVPPPPCCRSGCLHDPDTGARGSHAANEWLQVGSLQEGAHPGAGEVAGDQHGGTRWDLLSSQQWNLVWSGYVWWGVSHRPSPWSLVLLVVVCMWTKDRLFLRDQPFKTRWMLSTQTFLSLRWILGALKSWWFFGFFLSFKTVNQGISLFFIFAFWFERNQTIIRWKLLSACLPHHRNEWISYLENKEFLRILLNCGKDEWLCLACSFTP